MKQRLDVAGCGKQLWKQVLLVTLSFTLMTKQIQVGRDRDGEQIWLCRNCSLLHQCLLYLRKAAFVLGALQSEIQARVSHLFL